jgi:hypothetical protein
VGVHLIWCEVGDIAGAPTDKVSFKRLVDPTQRSQSDFISLSAFSLGVYSFHGTRTGKGRELKLLLTTLVVERSLLYRRTQGDKKRKREHLRITSRQICVMSGYSSVIDSGSHVRVFIGVNV